MSVQIDKMKTPNLLFFERSEIREFLNALKSKISNECYIKGLLIQKNHLLEKIEDYKCKEEYYEFMKDRKVEQQKTYKLNIYDQVSFDNMDSKSKLEASLKKLKKQRQIYSLIDNFQQKMNVYMNSYYSSEREKFDLVLFKKYIKRRFRSKQFKVE